MKLSPDVLALNPQLSRAEAKQASIGDGYKSNLERRCARDYMPQHFIDGWQYEAVKLRFPGGWYTPDFFAETLGGLLVFVEVKGWNPNLRADRLKFRAAAETHQWARFLWLEWDKRAGWVEKWA